VEKSLGVHGGTRPVQISTLLTIDRNQRVLFVSGGCFDIGKPEEAVSLTISGTKAIHPPADAMTHQQFAAWVKELRRDRYVVWASDYWDRPVTIKV
jgi:hypothetical protein